MPTDTTPRIARQGGSYIVLPSGMPTIFSSNRPWAQRTYAVSYGYAAVTQDEYELAQRFERGLRRRFARWRKLYLRHGCLGLRVQLALWIGGSGVEESEQ